MKQNKKSKNKDQDKKDDIETPIPPQRMDPSKRMKDQEKGVKDRNKGP